MEELPDNDGNTSLENKQYIVIENNDVIDDEDIGIDQTPNDKLFFAILRKSIGGELQQETLNVCKQSAEIY